MSKWSGFTQIDIAEAGTSFASPTTIAEKDIITENSSAEPEENEDQTDPTGNSPWTGQFMVVSLESEDFTALTAIRGFRTASPEKLIDIKLYKPNGAGGTETMVINDCRAKTREVSSSEKGQANTWILETRGYSTSHFSFS